MTEVMSKVAAVMLIGLAGFAFAYGALVAVLICGVAAAACWMFSK